MEFEEKDAEVIKVLTQLKNVEGGYPVEMMALRRQTYIKHLAGLGVSLGAGGVLKQALKGGGGSAIPPAAGTLLETILIVAIVAEAAAVALMNREKVTDFILTISNQPNVVEVVSTSVEITPPVTELVVPTTVQPTLTATTVTAAPTGTPAPALLFITSVSESEEAASQILATPKPQDNNGNQYGLTPKPERTKDSGGGDSGGGDDGGGDDQKPKKDNGKK